MRKKDDFQKLKNAVYVHSKHVSGFAGGESYYQKVNSLWKNIQSPPRRPDGYVFENGVLLILEHFEFDSSEITEHGSEEQFINSDTEEQLEQQIRDIGIGVVTEHVARSGKFYVDNFTKSFVKHAKKIDTYKENLLPLIAGEIKEIIVGFVVEDASKLGFVATLLEGNKIKDKRIDIIQSKEFLDLFEETPKLDFVLYTTTTYEHNGYQVFLSRNDILEARKGQIVVSEIKESTHFTTTYAFNVILKKVPDDK